MYAVDLHRYTSYMRSTYTGIIYVCGRPTQVTLQCLRIKNKVEFKKSPNLAYFNTKIDGVKEFIPYTRFQDHLL